jgi:glucose 1-dehydrogenase
VQRVAIVTGGATGIGRTLSAGLAADGLAVVIGYHQNEAGARQALQAIEDAGGRAVLVQGDIGDQATAERLVSTAVAVFDRLDVLCAHAGITLFAPFLDTTSDTFDRLVATNLRGTYFMAQAAARRMVEQGEGGRIVLTSSVNARTAIETLSAYAVTKAGIEAMARNLAVELSPLGITVNAVAPGSTVNERNLADDPGYAERWAAINPAGRVGTGEDVLAAVRYLVAEDAGYITGQTIVVDGGWTAAGRAPHDVERLADRLRRAGPEGSDRP